MTLLAALTAEVEAAAHPHSGGADCACPVSSTPLADRPDATVVRHHDTVAKAHAPGADPTELALRLATAARFPDILLAPLDPAPTLLHDRLVSFWPYGTPVDPDDSDVAPWEATATLLAHLHRTPPPAGLPPMRGPAKAARAIARLHTALHATARTTTDADTDDSEVTGSGAADSRVVGREVPVPVAPPHRAPGPATPRAAAPVLAAWAALPAWARGETAMPGVPALCHGDLHLGQLVRHPVPDGAWRLIDVDDLGVGAPAWDLARPAAWYACGLLPPDAWSRFLGAYRRAGGPAVPATGDPWPALDVPARALTVQTAALALGKALEANRPLDAVEQEMIDTCARMVRIPHQLASGSPH
ncbi:phosphotransferase [Streptomyces broussonetiae]|uniref:Phosphotransferase n=1 Tax=Streptomyces broussonetiae TaxID=2686304 RepID=A0A6I6N5E4_9ACTN|nr:phosphotransferase [Streptomyces broussonetiae]QHA03616.1 phosphotransferase [Streptomyces broussonetiae]